MRFLWLAVLLMSCGLEQDLTVPPPGKGADPVRQQCRNLSPGCFEATGKPALPGAGCYVTCATDADCGAEETCRLFIVDPCAGLACDACGSEATVCVARN